jgi:hypothetical protein
VGAALTLVLTLAGLPGAAVAQVGCTISGTDGADVLTGTEDDDVICGLGGADRLVGGAGVDQLLGGAGDDVLEGGPGDDELFGGAHADLLYGGDGNDVLEGEDDTDYLDGGEGADVLSGGPGSDTCPLQTVDTRSSCTKASPVDPDDTTGTADVQQMIIGFVSAAPAWTFDTFASWTLRKIQDHGYFLVYVDTEGTEAAEFYALVYSNGTKLLGELHRDDESDTFVAALTASKPAGDRARVSIPWSHLDIPESRTYIRWYAQTLYVGGVCPDICFDRIPLGSDLLMRPTP